MMLCKKSVLYIDPSGDELNTFGRNTDLPMVTKSGISSATGEEQ